MTASPSPSSRKALLTLLVLPLLLLCLSLWQMGRVGGADTHAQELVELDAQLAELREMAAGPKAWSQTVEFADGKRYGALPMAFSHEKAADPACRPAIVQAGERRVSLLRDITLRPGDSVVLDGKVSTFSGSTSWPGHWKRARST